MSSARHLVISAPTGYNTRELLTPLKEYLARDQEIARITCLSPGARQREEIFANYPAKFHFVTNPPNRAGHERLLKELSPDIVVTPTAGLDDKDTPLLQAAQSLKLRTFTFVASWDNVYKMERLKQFKRPYVLADHLAVWNTVMRDHLRRVWPELQPGRISVIGVPRLDVFSQTEHIPSKSALYDFLGLPSDGGKLLHLATTELYPMEYVVKAVDDARRAGKLPRHLHLYASVHPGGDMTRHQAYAKKYGVVVRYSFGRRDNAPLQEFLYNPTPAETYLLVALFKHADVLINHSSTVAIESMLADVPVVNVKYGQRFDWWRWRRSMVYRDFQQHYADITRGGGTTIVTRSNQLIAAINQYLTTPEHKKSERSSTIKQLITYTDGSASRRLLDKIKEIAVR